MCLIPRIRCSWAEPLANERKCGRVGANRRRSNAEDAYASVKRPAAACNHGETEYSPQFNVNRPTAAQGSRNCPRWKESGGTTATAFGTATAVANFDDRADCNRRLAGITGRTGSLPPSQRSGKSDTTRCPNTRLAVAIGRRAGERRVAGRARWFAPAIPKKSRKGCSP